MHSMGHSNAWIFRNGTWHYQVSISFEIYEVKTEKKNQTLEKR